jgi:hypothetical protein
MVVPPSNINEELLVVPVSKSLLVACSTAYPLVEFNPEDSLKKLYQDIIFNLSQVRNCYRKDEALIKEVLEKEEKLLESVREN